MVDQLDDILGNFGLILAPVDAVDGDFLVDEVGL
jgi:hypothetical protein